MSETPATPETPGTPSQERRATEPAGSNGPAGRTGPGEPAERTRSTGSTGATEEAPRERPPDATPVAKLAQRDGGIALAALSLFAAADAWARTTDLFLASVLAVLDGAVVGVVLGTLAHEWGHFAGARWSGGIAPTRPLRSLFPIFALDMQRSSARSFRAMSVGGNLGHGLVVLVVLLALPLDAPGRVALLAGSFGFAVSASLTEVPIMRRAFAGASPVESFRGLSKEVLIRDRRLGAAAGVLLFLVL